MAAHEYSVKTYVATCLALVLLTLLTVGVSFLHLGSTGHLAVGLAVAAVKASLVLLIFMHLLIGNRLSWIVVAASVLWMFILFSLLFTDYLTRSIVPFAPGH